MGTGERTGRATGPTAQGRQSRFRRGTPPSADTIKPVVAFVVPQKGATVSGTVTLSASATDNIGIVGVQFTVDGVNAGAEVTGSSY